MKIPKFKSIDKKCKNCLEEGYMIGYNEGFQEGFNAGSKSDIILNVKQNQKGDVRA